jgi:hypothetical protein
MTRDDQDRFVRELCGSIEIKTREAIHAGRIPDHWDGVELREYLARRFADASYVWKRQSRQRKREFENYLLITPGL